MKQMIYIWIGLLTFLGVNLAVAQPVIPGFNVEVYAAVTSPHKLAFDPSGVLYVGNDAHSGSDRIHRVGLGGTSVDEYGDITLGDPDSVAFDASGAISGVPGSVLVGDSDRIVAIHPDETTFELLTGLGNVAYLDFDRTGRLIIADQETPFRLLVTTGGPPIQLGQAFLCATVDGANRIYSALSRGQIKVIASDGTALPDLISAPELGFFRGMEFGPYNSIWKGELIAISDNNNLYQIMPDGSATMFGAFVNPGDIAFGPDGALYVSDLGTDTIYRITPAEVLTVSIDIRPGYKNNPVDLSSDGRVKVVILTTDDFDASTVDASSTRFGPAEASPVFYRFEDIDSDGDQDLVIKYQIQETGITCGETEATLIGETFDGQRITGTDVIKTIGC